MITFSYRNFRLLMRTFPFGPKPVSVGLRNIPLSKPVLYVYNHISRRGEPLFLALGAPANPYVRFFAEITLAGTEYFERTKRDVTNSILSKSFQQRVRKNLVTQFWFERGVDYLTRLFCAQMRRLHTIPVYLHDPPTKEEEVRKRRINREALEECVRCLEGTIPVAIAPSGGSTSESVESPIYHTIVPTLASWLYKRGRVVQIVPSLIKERPATNQNTYMLYVADRILPYRALRLLLDRLRLKKYERPRLTVEFLPSLTFKNADPTKSEKLEFVKELQERMYEALR